MLFRPTLWCLRGESMDSIEKMSKQCDRRRVYRPFDDLLIVVHPNKEVTIFYRMDGQIRYRTIRRMYLR